MLLFFLNGSSAQTAAQTTGLKIAFLSDVHLQNVYGKLSDSDYRGPLNPDNGKPALMRTMSAQLHSTRLFNENYFAFLAALDDLVQRSVKFVVLPGDFSDDGQPLNVRGMAEILQDYTDRHDMHFFVITGNHDPVRPFPQEGGKTDYLGESGQSQVLMSKAGLYQSKDANELPVVVTSDIHKMGYAEVLDEMNAFGFFPKPADCYWATPFSGYSYENYSYEQAQKEAAIANRKYAVSDSVEIPDVSYLVEPVAGLWLLALDGNVYLPNDKAAEDPENADLYSNASIGYNQVLSNKQHLFSWVKQVTAEAGRLGKTLVVFSHFPTVDFNDDATPEIRQLVEPNQMDLPRVPDEEVSRRFAEGGVRVHFGGHMHLNDTGLRQYADSSFLVNVQVPSLAAYIPAYKLLTIHSSTKFEVETVKLDSVPRFRELFPLYEQEYARLQQTTEGELWERRILDAPDYKSYTATHLRQLVEKRYLNEDWPPALRDYLVTKSGFDLLQAEVTRQGIQLSLTADEEAELRAWTGFELIYDFYRLRSADKLAITDIGTKRIASYQLLFSLMSDDTRSVEPGSISAQIRLLGQIFGHFLTGAPADHFEIRLDKTKSVLLDLSPATSNKTDFNPNTSE